MASLAASKLQDVITVMLSVRFFVAGWMMEWKEIRMKEDFAKTPR